MALNRPDPLGVGAFKSWVADRLQMACPPLPRPGSAADQLLDHWFDVVKWHSDRYAEVKEIAHRAFHILGAGSLPDLSFSPPDIARIDAVAAMSDDDLRKSIKQGVTLMTTSLTSVWVDGVLGSFQAAGVMGLYEGFNVGCRLHLSSTVEVDLMNLRSCARWQFPSRYASLADAPEWMGLTQFEGECIRVVPETEVCRQRRFSVASLSFGPFIIVTKPRLNPPKRGTATWRPRMGRILGAVSLLALLIYAAFAWLAPLASALVAIVATFAFLLILLGSDSHVAPPSVP